MRATRLPGRARPRCCATTPAGRARSPRCRGSPSTPAAPGPAQARGPQPHRLAQDQQRARPGAADQADGQDPGHRRDRRRPARRRHRHRGRAARPGVRRLHGRGGHRAPGAQRLPDAAARRRGHPGDHRHAHAQGRDQRGDARLGGQRRDDALLLGSVAGPHPFPDGPRVPAGHRRRGPRSSARARRAGCPTWSSPASAAAPTRSASSPRSSTTTACGWSASRPAATASRPAGTRPSITGGSPACCTAPAPTCCRTRTARSSSRTRSRAGLDYPGVGPEHAYLHDIGRAEYEPVTDAEAMDAFALLCRTEGIIPALETRARPRRARCEVGQRARAGRVLLVNLSGRATRTSTPPAMVRPRRQEEVDPGPGLDTDQNADRGRGEQPTRPSAGQDAGETASSRLAERSTRRGPRAGPRWSATCRPASPTSTAGSRRCRALVEAGVDVVEVGLPVLRPGAWTARSSSGPSTSPLRRAYGTRDVLRTVEAVAATGAAGGDDLLEPDRALRRRRGSPATSPPPAAPARSRPT